MPRILIAVSLLLATSACPDPTVTARVYRDADGDGYGDVNDWAEADPDAPPGYVLNNEDCDDTNPDVFPGADEVCDGIDNNCVLGTTDEATATYYRDEDGDGHGTRTVSRDACELPSGYATTDDDCDDLRASVYPGATEICDEIDNNCDGTVDEGLTSTFYADHDGDTFGDATLPTTACEAPDGYVADATDCQDADPLIFPGAPEVCNGVDDDCDASVDEEVTSTFYLDNDGDTFGDVTMPTTACEAPLGYVPDPTDCQDADPFIYPGAPEVCNDLDDDCDGAADEDLPVFEIYEDADADGYGDVPYPDDCELPKGTAPIGGDCDDTDPDINPGETEICYDGIDQNCVPDACRRTGDLALGGTGTTVYARLEGGKAVGFALDVGDLDDDGWDDVVARDETDGLYQIWYGELVGTLKADTKTQFAFTTSHVAQGGVKFLGDLDGTAGEELGVAAQFATSGRKGRVYLLTDPIPSSPASSAWAILDGVDDDEGLARLGEQTYTQVMDGAGDFVGTGDNHAILGAPEWRDADGYRRGRAWLVDSTMLGGTARVDTVDLTLFSYDGPREAARFGGFVVGLGDVNGDGYDDVGIGEVGSTVRLPEPLFFVYHGSSKPASTDKSSTADLRISLKGGTYLGFSADGCADPDATSGRHVAISDQGLSKGSVIVVDGSLTGTQSLDPAKVDSKFALLSAPSEVLSMACGDLDADGYDDVVYQSYLAPPKNATVRVHYGPFALGTTITSADATYDMPFAFPLAVGNVGGLASDDVVAAQYRSGVIEVLFGGGE
jgi:hypothetical protein